MSVTELPRPGEIPAARGPQHRTKTFTDGYLDNSGAIVGREDEQHLLAGLVESLDAGGSAVVIHGEAGMGKTSLLGFVADCAERQTNPQQSTRTIMLRLWWYQYFIDHDLVTTRLRWPHPSPSSSSRVRAANGWFV